jgi:hypothetical protein
MNIFLFSWSQHKGAWVCRYSKFRRRDDYPIGGIYEGAKPMLFYKIVCNIKKQP